MMPTDHDQRLDALAAVEAFEKGDRDALSAVIAANEQHPERLVAGLAHLVAYITRLYGQEVDDDDLKVTALPLIKQLRQGVICTLDSREGEV